MTTVRYLQGNEAIALGAFAAGARFYAGYPITPSSEIAEVSSKRLPEIGGTYLQMEDEIASMAAVIGASLAGVKSFTATSGPGFSLMQENLGLAKMMEVPCVLINVQRSGPSTGLATKPAQGDVMQARWGTHGDSSVIALCPATVQDCFDLTVEAFNLSERFRSPVIVLTDEIVAHMRERVMIPSPEQIKVFPRRQPDGPGEYLPYLPDPDGVPRLAIIGEERIVHVTSSMHDETGRTNNDPANAAKLIARLSNKIEDKSAELARVRVYGDDNPDVLVVAYGAVSRAVLGSIDPAKKARVSIKLLQLLTIWPFPKERVRQESENARIMLVPEMNLGQLVREIRNHSACPVVSMTKSNGEPIEPGEILDRVLEVSR